MSPTTLTKPRHPAPWNRAVLGVIELHVQAEARALGRRVRVVDIFAGIGRVHDLPRRIAETVGVELELEWSRQRAGTIQGDATNLPADWTSRFDVVATSPCFANRMSDSFEAKDACFDCKGTGTAWTSEGCGDAPMFCASCGVACTCGGHAKALRRHVAACQRCRGTMCKACGGNGLSRRYTYRMSLGRPLSERNAGQMQWGEGNQGNAYRQLHSEAWAEAHRVLRPGGLAVINTKDHVRGGVVQQVTAWHAAELGRQGFVVQGVRAIPARGMRHGANASSRVDNEQLLIARRP